MKSSINFSLLCLLLGLQNVSAFMGFSFGNLLFSLHVCDKIGHGPLGCKLDCDKAFPPGPKHVCQSDCYVESNAVCSSYKGVDMSDYFQCMAANTEICNTSTYSPTSTSDSSASDGSVSSYVGDTSTSNGGNQPIATRVSLLPFFAAATISTLFLIFYVWRKNTKEQQLHKEKLLDSEESFHGAVAKRLGQAQPTPAATPAEAPMDEEQYPAYAMA